jgi:hypothetical protein
MLDVIRREQIAAQIVALMKADFSRPDDAEMELILDRARSQIRDAAQVRAHEVIPGQP